MKNTNKLGIYTSPNFTEVGLEGTIAAIAKAGFKSTFFGWKPEENFFERMRFYDKYGIEVDNLHAPFTNLNCIWREGQDGDDYVEYLSKCIKDVSDLHIPYVVMHPISGDSVPFSSKIGIDRWKKLVDYSISKNIKICFENVEFSEMLGIVMEEFGEDVGFCYDTGHESTNDPGIRFAKLFGDRLTCTHIHDNYGLSYLVTPVLHGDCHMIPLDATIDFKRVMKDIRDTGYKGTLMLESNRHGMLNTYSNYTAEEFYEKAFAALSEIAEY